MLVIEYSSTALPAPAIAGVVVSPATATSSSSSTLMLTVFDDTVPLAVPDV